ncbi:integrase core domain-containing protein [Streptomyces sp. NPDC055144]
MSAAVLRGRVAKDAEVLALRHENAVLRRQIARVRHEPADRIWFAALSRSVPRKRWRQVFAVTPTTLPAWHRRLAARKRTHPQRSRPGRPSTAPSVKQLILRLAKENHTWGHRRIQGELARLDRPIAPSTIWEILRAADIDPAPQHSGPTWREFLTAQASSPPTSCTSTAPSPSSARTPWSSSSTTPAASTSPASPPTPPPHRPFKARNLAMALGCRMDSLRFLLRDRDSKYTSAFDAVFEADDVKVLLSPPRAPKANAICGRVVGTLRRELLDHMLTYNEAHAVKVPTEYIQHYDQHRPHRSRQQLPPDSTESSAPATVTDLQNHRIRRQPILGTLINEYHRAA